MINHDCQWLSTVRYTCAMGWHFCYIPIILTLKLGDTSSIKIFSQLCCMPTFLIIWPPACLPIQAWGDIWILLVSDWHPCPTLSRWSPRPICPIGRSLSQCQTLYITSLTLVNVSIRLITTMSTLNFTFFFIVFINKKLPLTYIIR